MSETATNWEFGPTLRAMLRNKIGAFLNRVADRRHDGRGGECRGHHRRPPGGDGSPHRLGRRPAVPPLRSRLHAELQRPGGLGGRLGVAAANARRGGRDAREYRADVAGRLEHGLADATRPQSGWPLGGRVHGGRLRHRHVRRGTDRRTRLRPRRRARTPRRHLRLAAHNDSERRHGARPVAGRRPVASRRARGVHRRRRTDDRDRHRRHAAGPVADFPPTWKIPCWCRTSSSPTARAI